MPNDKSLNLENKTTEQQSDELLGYTNKIINDAMASCDVPTFAAVELQIPSVIQSDTISHINMPKIDNYFSKAQNIWQDLTNNALANSSQLPSSVEQAPLVPNPLASDTVTTDPLTANPLSNPPLTPSSNTEREIMIDEGNKPLAE